MKLASREGEEGDRYEEEEEEEEEERRIEVEDWGRRVKTIDQGLRGERERARRRDIIIL